MRNSFRAIGKKARSVRSCKTFLEILQTILSLAKAAAGKSDQLMLIYGGLRKQIHQMEHLSDLSTAAIEASKVLESGGLPSVMSNNIPGLDLPWDVCLDAGALLKRWQHGDTDVDVHRGLILAAKDRSWIKDPFYSFSVSCKYHGQGELIVGQWFANFLSAKIHGAHGAPGAGIHGDYIKGAFSVVLSGGYDNVDQGETIKYCSTKGRSPDSPTRSTRYMIESCKKLHKIRVLRSAGLPKDNPYRPEEGLRYDGLYLIDKYDLVDKGLSEYRFDMTRVAGQPPIRYKGPEVRPTSVELRELRLIQDSLKPCS